MNKETYYSNGKLLLTGEYVVLDGALALAVPTKFGQSLVVETIDEPKIIWNSFDNTETTWFNNEFKLDQPISSQTNSNHVTERLVQIFNAIKQLNPKHFKTNSGFKISTHLGFQTNWGLGTSSTLINNLAEWAKIDAFTLLEKTFGGSGYDIACAKNKTPITYQLNNNSKPSIGRVNFNPAFKEQLYFVHLNEKQNSRIGIKNYNANKGDLSSPIKQINTITNKMINCVDLTDFEALLTQHEAIIAQATHQTPVKELLFPDYDGAIKSLGAWGGDFVLVTSKINPTPYFINKGFHTVIPYNNMVL